MSRRICLLRDAFPARASFDTAISRALLLRAAAGELPEMLRLYRPDAIVAFGGRDRAADGFADAVRAARAQGFDAVLRLAGGRAAVFHEGTVALARAIPDSDPTSRTVARFEETSDLVASALRTLGVDARVGEVPGEYCPGDHSVNIGGLRKLAGIGQRLVAGAAHLGGVVVVTGANRIRRVLDPVYAALRVEWDPATTGAIADEVAVEWEDVFDAIRAEFAARFEIEESAIDQETTALAERLEADHRIPH
ncbi:MAG: lipoate--protein ligase family protein [Actinomycetota bacterium]